MMIVSTHPPCEAFLCPACGRLAIRWVDLPADNCADCEATR